MAWKILQYSFARELRSIVLKSNARLQSNIYTLSLYPERQRKTYKESLLYRALGKDVILRQRKFF